MRNGLKTSDPDVIKVATKKISLKDVPNCFEELKPQKIKDLVSGFTKKYPNPIPKAVYYTILLFYWRSLKSGILTNDECDILLNLFQKNDKFQHLSQSFDLISYDLIFQNLNITKSVEHHFKLTCHNKQNILCIIHTQNNHVFGGFTANGWPGIEPNKKITDDKAFIFSIRSSTEFSPTIYDVNQPTKALAIINGEYCCFGNDSMIYIFEKGLPSTVAVYSENSYQRFDKRQFIGDCGSYSTSADGVQAVEVFQLKM